MRSLSFAKLNPDLTGGLKDCRAVAFDGILAKAHAQTRQADGTHQFVLEPQNRNRQPGNVRITFAKAEIIPRLADAAGLFALPDGIGLSFRYILCSDLTVLL